MHRLQFVACNDGCSLTKGGKIPEADGWNHLCECFRNLSANIEKDNRMWEAYQTSRENGRELPLWQVLEEAMHCYLLLPYIWNKGQSKKSMKHLLECVQKTRMDF